MITYRPASATVILFDTSPRTSATFFFSSMSSNIVNVRYGIADDGSFLKSSRYVHRQYFSWNCKSSVKYPFSLHRVGVAMSVSPICTSGTRNEPRYR